MWCHIGVRTHWIVLNQLMVYPLAKVYTSLDFFAGSGLVRLGLEPDFRTVWANDVCPKKQAVYAANFGDDGFHLDRIENINGSNLPSAELAWASFPCQDLSLAGNLTGMKEGTRSGLFWEWMRVLDELAASNRRVPILVAENVVGFVVAHNGRHFRRAYDALRERGYRVGALVIDAKHFLPQSRPRAFVVAVDESIELADLTLSTPSAPFHTDGLVRTVRTFKSKDWVWWSLPSPSDRQKKFRDIVERRAECETQQKTRELRGMLSPVNRKKLKDAIELRGFLAGTGYRRTRPDDMGNPQQRLELRFDGIAGCLRTPEGGSGRQVVMIVEQGKVRTRLMTVRECARLMGAPETFSLPGSYNDGYRAMGDAVAVPVTRWVTGNLLAPLAGRYRRALGQKSDRRHSASPSAA
jgi:DNA (cytosine-5)-methyltransferase 1